MKYFVKNSERESTCYHEFYKGKWDEKTFWKEDSLLLHDDVMFKNQGFVDAVMEVIPTYDPFGETEISPEIWKKIGQVIKEKDERAKELYDEADVWLKDVPESVKFHFYKNKPISVVIFYRLHTNYNQSYRSKGHTTPLNFNNQFIMTY